ncbi:putative methionyl-tRNA synthetase [Hordeum vulgare]|nr:putative methionyl-tRNA synthetase [Hordeum vulgare]
MDRRGGRCSPESGTNVEGQMFVMYRADNEDQELKFLHVFSRIVSCENLMKDQLALDKAKETYIPDAPPPAVAEGRPYGTKKARATRDAAPAAERLQASIKQCIADVKSSAATREEKSGSALMINVVPKKRNTDLGFLIVADTSTLDEQVQPWYLVERDLILSHMLAPATTTATTTMAAPTTMPSASATTPTTSPTTPTMTPTNPAAEEPHHAEPIV